MDDYYEYLNTITDIPSSEEGEPFTVKLNWNDILGAATILGKHKKEHRENCGWYYCDLAQKIINQCTEQWEAKTRY